MWYPIKKQKQTKARTMRFGLWFMVFNATFNNISVISWRWVLLIEEIGVPGENHLPVSSYWQTLSPNVVSSTPRHERGSNSQLLVVIGIDCICSCKTIYHPITTTTTPRTMYYPIAKKETKARTMWYPIKKKQKENKAQKSWWTSQREYMTHSVTFSIFQLNRDYRAYILT
jgi:hypothetical protein